MRIQIALFAALAASACSSTPTVDSAPAPLEPVSVVKEEVAVAEEPGKAANNTALAKQTQNPVANLISLPIQNNTDGGIGPDNAKQNTTNIQPV